MAVIQYHRPNEQEIKVLQEFCDIGMLDECDAKQILMARLPDVQSRLQLGQTPEQIAVAYTLRLINGDQPIQHAAIVKLLSGRPGVLVDHVRNLRWIDIEQMVADGNIPEQDYPLDLGVV